MSTMSAVVHARTVNERKMTEQKVKVRDLIRHVESLLSDERYPPLYHVRVDLKIPFLIKYPRP
jgi:hypothetical protein